MSPSNTIERIQLLRGGAIALAFPMSLQRALDLLHERLVLQDVQRLLLPLPVLGADDDEILTPAPLDAERHMIFDHLLDGFPQVAAEVMDGYFSHDPDCTRNWYNSEGTATVGLAIDSSPV